jgi:hypothetical protein
VFEYAEDNDVDKSIKDVQNSVANITKAPATKTPLRASAAKRLQEFKELENRIVEPNVNVFVPPNPLITPTLSSSAAASISDNAAVAKTSPENQLDGRNLDELQEAESDAEAMDNDVDDGMDSDLVHEEDDSAHMDNSTMNSEDAAEQVEPAKPSEQIKSKSMNKAGEPLKTVEKPMNVSKANPATNKTALKEIQLLQNKIIYHYDKAEGSKLDDTDYEDLVNDTTSTLFSRNTTKTFYTLSDHLDASSVKSKQSRFGDMGESFGNSTKKNSTSMESSPSSSSSSLTLPWQLILYIDLGPPAALGKLSKMMFESIKTEL